MCGHVWPCVAIFVKKMCKIVQKCDRTSHAQKRAASTHITNMFQIFYEQYIDENFSKYCNWLCLCHVFINLEYLQYFSRSWVHHFFSVQKLKNNPATYIFFIKII